MKVLLIGGSGNISPAIAAELLRLGHDVTVFNRGNHHVPGVKQIIGDRYDHDAFVAKMKAYEFDCVVDQICYTEAQARSLVEAFSGRIRQLVFCSTVNTYIAPAPFYPVTEQSPIGCDPEFEYGYQKVLCEQLLGQAAASGAFELTIIRPGCTYNDTSTPIHFVGTGKGLLYRLKAGKPIILLDSGASLWGHAHRDDVGRAIAHAVGNPKAYGEGYTLATPEVMTWEQVYTVIAEEMGAPKPEFVHVPYYLLDHFLGQEHSWNRLNFRFNNIYDSSKAARDLDFRYTITWREGVRRMLRYHEAAGDIDETCEHPLYDTIVERMKHAYQTLLSQ